MVRAGWAEMYVVEQPFARVARYKSAASRAKQQLIGAWDVCDGDFHRPA